MPHPKRRHSATRRDKRRTHDKLMLPSLTTCKATGQFHITHNAHWYEGKMYYRGRVLIDNSESK